MKLAPCYSMLTLYILNIYCLNCFTLHGIFRTLLSLSFTPSQVHNAINFMLKILQIIQEKFVANFATNNNEIISTLFKSNYSKMMKQEIGA